MRLFCMIIQNAYIQKRKSGPYGKKNFFLFGLFTNNLYLCIHPILKLQTSFINMTITNPAFLKPLILILVSFWTFTTSASADVSNDQLRSLYEELDHAIEQSPGYVDAYEDRIARTKKALRLEHDGERQMQLCFQLFQLYKAYQNDSALIYIQRYIDMARQGGHYLHADQGRALMAFQCSTVGLYTEALDILQAITPGTLSGDALVDYYTAYVHVYGKLAEFCCIPSMSDDYFFRHNQYRDSIFLVAQPHSDAYLQCLEERYLESNNPEEALKVNDSQLAQVEDGSRDYAIVTFYRYLIFNDMNRRNEAAYWLCKSALTDIKNAVMDQASLIELANIVNENGDFKRSYRYIRFTWECNKRFDNRTRLWHITPIQNAIEKNYQNELRHITRVQTIAMNVAIVLALFLLGLLLFLRHRNKQLNNARLQLHEANQQLVTNNAQLAEQADKLSTLNAEQTALNASLSSLNIQLSEANQVKEEYIGRFMSLCSQYINKLDDYRKMVNRKMKNRELDDLFQITKSTELKERELEELYQNFDSVFLHLFPTFVADFNALLQPSYRIQPKTNSQLTTDLRIFALIRLGIEDSSKIAEFLHYSVNTIYNYRARTKNCALGNRGMFEQNVKEIGLPKS